MAHGSEHRSTPEETVKRFIDGFNRHDGSVMKLFAQGVAWQDPGGLEPERGWERMQNGILSAYKVFPGIRMDVSHILAKDDWACFEGTISGTFKGGKWFVGGGERILRPTNRHVKLSTAWFFRFDKEGLISFWSFYWDNLQFLAQIGLKADQIGMGAGA